MEGSGTTGPRSWSLADFRIERFLGQGRFSTVYLAREMRTGYKVALKAVRKEAAHAVGMQHQLEREVRVQRYASRHRHVLRLLAFFWDAEHVFLVTEYADGGALDARTVTRLVERAGGASVRERLVAGWAHGLFEAVAFLHERGVRHRDIKPENVLLRRGSVKLADFTWCVAVDDEGVSALRRTFCGTLDYLPPEILARRPYDERGDIWSAGAVVYTWLVGEPPFNALTDHETCRRISTADTRFPDELAEDALDFLRLALCVDPTQRPTAQTLLDHRWLAAVKPE